MIINIMILHQRCEYNTCSIETCKCIKHYIIFLRGAEKCKTHKKKSRNVIARERKRAIHGQHYQQRKPIERPRKRESQRFHLNSQTVNLLSYLGKTDDRSSELEAKKLKLEEAKINILAQILDKISTTQF